MIFIAGTRRINLGTIGAHRPYLSDTPQNEDTLRQQVPRVLAIVKRYVAEMGITNSFYEAMVNTGPS